MELQIIIIYVGKSVFHIVDKGLTGEQWGIYLGFNTITFAVSFIIKLIPEEEEKKNMENEDKIKVPEGEILSMIDNNKKVWNMM